MASATVGILRVLLTADAAEFASGIKAAQNAAASLGKDFKQLGQQATELGGMLSKTLTLPLVGLGVGAAKAAMDFESSFAGVRKTVQATDAEFAIMEQSFRDLSTVIPINVNDLNRLGEAAGALGIPKEEVVDFARVMALLGVTTNVTADQAAESIGKIQNIFGAAGKDTDRFASTLVALGNDGASTEQQILEMATRIAGAGHTVGLTQGQVLAFGSALASVGLEAEAGGTAISRTFFTINDAVMSGGQALDEFARVAGMSAAQFKQAFQQDAAAATTAFISGLARIKGEGENVNQVLKGLELGEIRVRDTLIRAAGAGDLLTRALALQGTAWTENSALTKEAAERFKTTESQLTLLWNRIKDVGITLGNALLPSINLAISAVGQLVPVIDAMARGFAVLPAPVQALIIGLGAVVAAAGPAIWIFGQLITASGAVVGAFAAKGVAMRALTVLFPSLTAATATQTTATTTLGVTSGATAVGVGTLGAAVKLLSTQFLLLFAAAVAIPKIIEAIGLASKLAGERTERANSEVTEQDRRYRMMSEAARISGQSVHTYGVAVEIVTAHARKNKDALDAMIGPTTAMQGPTLDLAEAHKNLSKELEDTKKKVAALSPETRKQIDAGLALGHSVKEVANELKLSEPIVEVYKDQLSATTKETKKTSDEAKKLADINAFLRASTESLTVVQRASVDGYLRQGLTAEQTALKMKLPQPVIEKYIQTIEILADSSRAESEASSRAWQSWAKQVEDAALRAMEAVADNAEAMKSSQDELDDLVRKRTMPRLQYEIDAIIRAGEEKKKQYEGDAQNYQIAADAMDALTEEKVTQLVLHSNEVTAALAAMSGMFPGLLPFLHDYADTVGAAGEKTKGWGAAFSDVLLDIPNKLMAAFTGGGGFSGAFKAIAIDLGTTLGTQLAKSFGNASVSASASAWGSVFGGIAGIYIAAWKDGKTVSLVNTVGNLWGHTISKAMAEAIEADANNLFRGDLGAAALFNLKKNIDDTVGGVSANFGKFADLLGKAVLGYAAGTFTAAQATKILGETWADFAAAGTDATGRLAPQLVLVHQAATALGLKVPEITQYLKDQAAIVTSGFAATIGAFEGQFASYSRFGDAVKAAQKDVDDLRGKIKEGDTSFEAYRSATVKVTEALAAQSGAALAAQAPLADLGLIALSAFNAAFKASGDYYGALQSIGPQLTTLQKAYADLGLNIEDSALRELMLQNQILSANPALVTAIGSLSQQFIALSNMGLLNEQTFRAMERTGLGMYTKLQAATAAAGGTTRDALLPMQQYLHDAEVQAALLGIPLDANTQMLIAQSKELGIWKDKGKDANEKLYDGVLLLNTTMQSLVDLIAAKLAPAIAGIGPAGVGAAAEAEGGIRGKLIPALMDAKAAADALNFGESPGGLKEIPLLLGKAGVSAGSFAEKFTKLFGVDCVGAIDKTLVKFWRLDEANDRVLLNFNEKWKIGLKTWQDDVGGTVDTIIELFGNVKNAIPNDDLMAGFRKGMGDPLLGGIGRGGSGDVGSMFRDIPALGNGGIVTAPTLAWFGESGRETDIPISTGGGPGVTTQRINVYLDSRVLTKATVRGMPSVLELHGVKTS